MISKKILHISCNNEIFISPQKFVIIYLLQCALLPVKFVIDRLLMKLIEFFFKNVFYFYIVLFKKKQFTLFSQTICFCLHFKLLFFLDDRQHRFISARPSTITFFLFFFYNARSSFWFHFEMGRIFYLDHLLFRPQFKLPFL